MTKFSDRTNSIGSASSIAQNELVYKLRREGKNPIILSYGEAPFRTTPLVSKPSDWDRGSHYSEGLGVPELRNDIVDYCVKYYGFSVDPETEVMITAGSKIASYYISQLFLNPNDSILLHEPSWVSYQEHARLSGAKTNFISFGENIHEAKKYISTNNLKLVYINNPNNPRGYVYTEEELRYLAELCEYKDIILAVDESYSDFCINKKFYSAGKLIKNFRNVVLLNSFSKNFGLSGWRLGYVMARSDVISGLNKFNQHLMTCASTNLQLTLVGNLENLRKEIQPQIKEINNKRNSVEKILKRHGVKYLSGDSTFYIFLDYRDKIKNTKTFVIDLLNKKGVSIIPGSSYGKSTEGFLRLSFAIESLERIEHGILMISELLTET